MKNGGGRPAWMMTGQYAPKAVSGAGSGVVDSPRQTAAELRKAAESGTTSSSSTSNANAAADLRAMLKGGGGGKGESPDSKKRKHEDGDESDEEPLDEVGLLVTRNVQQSRETR